MDAKKLIDRVTLEGLTIAATPIGTLKISGHEVTVNRWLPILREHKPDIIALLAPITDKNHLSQNATMVFCAACQHFKPDTIGDGTGIGTCRIGHKPRGGNEPPLYPKARRYCSTFTKKRQFWIIIL
jgi:hypothetical protein